jgi:pimeloyl-ACP methyl ester carboxylesterase
MTRAVCVVAVVLACARPAGATQVAAFFVHGKGDHSLINQGSAWAYWDNGRFMNETTEWGCTPYGYSYVDGTYNLEEAAFSKYYWSGWWPDTGYIYEGGPGVSDFMANFIRRWNVTDLIVVTHSMGGNVVRTILSEAHYWDWCADTDPFTHMWDPLCRALRENQRLVQSRVKAVFAIAAPFTGSEAADYASALRNSWPPVAWIGQWLSGGDPSTVACTTTSMAKKNAKLLYGTAGRPWDPTQPIAQWVAMASWNYPSQMANDWLHAEDGGLVTVAALVPFPDNLSDGLVGYYSQRAVGTSNSGTIFRNNHYHSKYIGRDPVWVGNPGCGGVLVRPDGTPYCAYLDKSGGTEICTSQPNGVLCQGTPYGPDEAVRVQNSLSAWELQKCGASCRSFCLP